MDEQIPLVSGVELRMLHLEHADAIFATVEAHRAHLREWLPWVDGSTEAGHTLLFLKGHCRHRNEGLTFDYALWEQGEVVGMVGVHDIVTAQHAGAIGYWLARTAQGRGLITAATRSMLEICFGECGMERVEIRCALGNTRSAAVPERLGFTVEGILRHAQLLHGQYVDLRLYSLLREEFYSSSSAS